MIIIDKVDKSEMERIHDNSFPLPDISNKLYILQKTAIEDNKTVAIGLVRITAEGILITDQSLPLTLRARASANLIRELKIGSSLAGLDECHVFVHSPKVQSFLKALDFEDSLGGKAMVIHF